jgi:hypothetical protein
MDAMLDLAIDEDLRTEFSTDPTNGTDPQAVPLDHPYIHPCVSDGGAHVRYLTLGTWPVNLLAVTEQQSEIFLPAPRRARRYHSAFVDVAIALLGMGIAGSASSAEPGAATDRPTTASPIKHVIVVIGENRSFDHLHGTHVPPSGDSISNLLLKGIVRADGSPGPHFAKAQQFTTSGQTSYFISVAKKNKTRRANRSCRPLPDWPASSRNWRS